MINHLFRQKWLSNHPRETWGRKKPEAGCTAPGWMCLKNHLLNENNFFVLLRLPKIFDGLGIRNQSNTDKFMKFYHLIRCNIRYVASEQMWRIMKLIIVIMTVFLMQVSASGFGQQLTIRKNNVSMRELFSQIRKQTGYVVLATSDLVDKSKPFDLNLEQVPLEDALKGILSERGLEYSIKGKSISVSEKDRPSFLERLASAFDNIDVRGKVLDEQGAPLAGATVKVKGTGRAASTDRDGNFYLQGVDEKAVLVVSYIGYGEKEVKAEKNLSVVLKMVTGDLSEVNVVNKGYYQTTKELNTGSVARVTAEEIQKQPVANPFLALQGRVPGLQIHQDSGQPGQEGPGLRIRGQNSIANGSDPLIIIDNVPFVTSSLSTSRFYGFNSINPSDIESIDVLKDADATAIYGSRGANGVILITTKKGQAGVTRLDANVYSGWGNISGDMKFLNTQQYVQMRKEALRNDGLQIDPARDYDLVAWDTTKYTDWQKSVIGNTTHSTDAELSVSGGSNNTKFLLSGGFHKETMLYPGDFYDERGSFRANINHTSADKKLSVNFSASYASRLNQAPGGSLMGALSFAPNTPDIYNTDGTLNWANSAWNNPFSNLVKSDKTILNNLISNLNLSYLLLPGLKLNGTFGFNNYASNNLVSTPKSALNPSSFPEAMAQYVNSTDRVWTIEPTLTYQKKFGDHGIEVLLGGSLMDQQQDVLTQTGTGYSDDALLENRAAAVSLTSRFDYAKYRFSSIYARVGYNYKEKYIVNLTGRRDGSTRFGPGKQFGNFGSIGAGWVFSKEQFIADALPFLSLAKLRASYGVTGNDQIGDYNYLNTYRTNQTLFQGVVPLEPSRLSNSDFAWEVNRKAELAIELGFFKDRIGLNVSVFRNRSSNMLLPYKLPTITGFGSVVKNLPAVVQNTGLELELRTVNIKQRNFNWTSFLNLTLPKNKLISYPGIETSPYANGLKVGQSLSIRQVYQYTGVDPQSGLYTFMDYNNDGVISAPNDAKTVVDMSQQLYGGFQNNIQWGRWQVDFLLQFVRQKTVENYYYNSLPNIPGTANINVPDFVLGRWQKPGDITDVQKFSTAVSAVNAYNLSRQSTLMYSDGSYIRLKNISLSYDLPTNWTKCIKASNARVFVQGQNLFTITDYFGLDPESFGAVPPIKIMTIGARLSF